MKKSPILPTATFPFPLRIVTLVLICLVPVTEALTASTTDLPLIPYPQQWQPAPDSFALDQLVRVLVSPGDRSWEELGNQAARWLDPVLSHKPAVQLQGIGQPAPGSLLITRAADLEADAYRLEITTTGIVLAAATDTGAFSGLMSLLQLALGSPERKLSCGRITDAPRFQWRGMLLDCGRHFMPVPMIKEVLDALALHKFNVLHWHLTEDQGWRLEVPGLPGLTATSAWRTGHDGQRTGGYYSTADVREIVAYAAARHIEVVPEIEMPGHTVAVLAAYPELSCSGGPFTVETQYGIHPEIFCAGNDDVFTFLETVLTYVMEVFPSRYIHIGGDEAPKKRWRACSRCQARMQTEGLANEAELQSWFIQRVEKFLAAHDRRLIGWDEILEGGLMDQSPGATIQAWRGLRGAIVAARAGHDAIVSPTSHAYFDYDPGVLDVQQVYGFDPVPEQLESAAAHHILGGEMNLWTEYLPPENVPGMLAPRLAAMAEALWTGTRENGFPEFLRRLERHGPVWSHLHWTPGAAARPVSITGQYDADSKRHRLTFALDERLRTAFSDKDLTIRYRDFPLTDYPDYEPGLWPEQQRPNKVPPWSPIAPKLLDRTCGPGDADVLHLAQAFIAGRPYGAPALVQWSPHLALGREAGLERPASRRYPAGGQGWLLDGQLGGPSYHDGRWAGFEGADLVATIDLGQDTELTCLSLRFLQDATAWIFLPTDVRFSWSADGSTWHELAVQSHDVSSRDQRKIIREFAVKTPGIQARLLRVRARNRGTCPEWHPGRGQPCWIFSDEFVVR